MTRFPTKKEVQAYADKLWGDLESIEQKLGENHPATGRARARWAGVHRILTGDFRSFV